VLRLDLKKVAEFARDADTEDLLDRVTVYRDQMEPEAVDVLEAELDRRGVSADEIDRHAADRGASALVTADGSTVRCTYCDRPAVKRGWAWHWLWGKLPVLPRPVAWCEVHRPAKRDESAAD
jgi:hypothetical protein